MKIAIVSVYNERPRLSSSLGSIINHVDQVVVIDGAIKGFPLINRKAYSTDGTQEFARKYSNKVNLIQTEKVWPSQVEKRNAGLIGKEGDWYIVLDADEIFKGNLNEVKKDIPERIKGFFIPIREPEARILGDPTDRMSLRIFRAKDELCYRLTHYTLFYLNDILTIADCLISKDAKITHCRRGIEDKDWEKRSLVFKLKQSKVENESLRKYLLGQ